MILESISSVSQNKYERKFASMGQGLLLLRVNCLNKIATPFHYFYENGRKPPFDIAIDPVTQELSYLKFFLQNEKFKNNFRNIKIDEFKRGFPIISTEQFNDKVYQIFKTAYFEPFLKNQSLFVINQECRDIFALEIDDKIQLLFDYSHKFAGVILKDLTIDEVNELKKADV